MRFEIGIENNVEGGSLAWGLGHPGCFAYGPDSVAALAAMPDALVEYAAWIARHTEGGCWIDPVEVELCAVETWEVYTINEAFDLAQEGYEVNAWFRHDWKPLIAQEVERAAQLLSWSRVELLEAVRDLDQESLDAQHPGERWSIAGILKHVGGAEWWYLDRLGLAFPRDQVPDSPFDRLEVIRAHLLELLPSLIGSSQVVGVYGEFWSPRKLVRRAVWHERDHTQHIHKLR